MVHFNQDVVDFYDNYYEKKDAALILLYMVATLGLYSFLWVYHQNKLMNNAGFLKPNYQWGSFVLYIFPIGWIINFIGFKFLLGENYTYYNDLLNLFGWLTISILLLVYLYDFCRTFGYLTKTSGLVWYFAIYIGFLGFVMGILQLYILSAMASFLIVSIPGMQAQMNFTYENVIINQRKVTDYMYKRGGS